MCACVFPAILTPCQHRLVPAACRYMGRHRRPDVRRLPKYYIHFFGFDSTRSCSYPRGPWLKAPFVQPLAFKAVPPICTSARLVVGVRTLPDTLSIARSCIHVYQVVGRPSQRLTLGPSNYVTVYAGTGTGTPLGKLFNNQNALLNEDRQL